MKYATVCSGIEAPTVAWHGLGLNPEWFSEIEPFPCKLLKHHYPNVPNLGDMTKLNEHETYRNTTIDLFCGGTPCQSFSIAGLRGGLDDERGNLALEYCRILIAKRPRWFVWENVPGVFSSNGGKDFACILSAFTGTEVNAAGIGNAGIIQGELYSVAWRVLDAQYFGVPQRRRRVFVIGYTGNNWRAPYAVLFEPESLRRDFTPRREKGQNTTGTVEGDINCTEHGISNTITSSLGKGGISGKEMLGCVTVSFGLDEDKNGWVENSGTLQSHKSGGKEHAVVYDAVAFGHQNSHTQSMGVNNITPTLDKSKTPAVVYDTTQITSPQNGSNPTPELCHPLCKGQHVPLVTLNPVCFQQNTRDEVRFVNGDGELAGALMAEPGMKQQNYVLYNTLSDETADTITKRANQTTGFIGEVCTTNSVARRLTPLECERLQGFPDNYTNIPGATGWRKAQPYETEQYCIENNLKYKVTKAGKIRVQDADGPRYAATGNSMAVPVMRWIGERIVLMDKVLNNLKTKAA